MMPIVDDALAKREARRSKGPKKAKRVQDPAEEKEFLDKAVAAAKIVGGKLLSSIHGPLKNGFPDGVWEPSDSPAVHMLQSLQAQVDAFHTMGVFQKRKQSYFAAHLEAEYGLTYESVSQTIAEHIEWVRNEHQAQRARNLTADLSSLPLLYEWDLPGVRFPEFDPDKMVNGRRNMSIGEAFDRALAVLVLNGNIGSSALSEDIRELVETMQPYAQQFEDTAKAMADAQTRYHLHDLPELWTQYANPSEERANLFSALWKRYASTQTSASIGASLDAASTLPTGMGGGTKRPGTDDLEAPEPPAPQPNPAPPGMDYVGEGASWPGTGAMDTFASDNASVADWFNNVGKYHRSWVKRRPIAASAAAVPLALSAWGCAAPVVLASHLAISAAAWLEDTKAQKYATATGGAAGTAITAATSGRTPLGQQFYALDRCAMPEAVVRKPLVDLAGDGATASGDVVGSYMAHGTHSWWTGTVGPVANAQIENEVQQAVKLGTQDWLRANIHRMGTPAFETEKVAQVTAIREKTIKGIIERTVECTRGAAAPGGGDYLSDIQAAARPMVGGVNEELAREAATELWGDGARRAVKASDGDGWLSSTWSKSVGKVVAGTQAAAKVVFDYHRRYKPDRARLYLYNNRPNIDISVTSNQVKMGETTAAIKVQDWMLINLRDLHEFRDVATASRMQVSEWLKEQKEKRDAETVQWQRVYSEKDNPTNKDPVVNRSYQRPLFNDYNKQLFDWADRVSHLVQLLQDRRIALDKRFGIGPAGGVNFKALRAFGILRDSYQLATLRELVGDKTQGMVGVDTKAFMENREGIRDVKVGNQFYALHHLSTALMDRAKGAYDRPEAPTKSNKRLEMGKVVNLIHDLHWVVRIIVKHNLTGDEETHRVGVATETGIQRVLASHVEPLEFKDRLQTGAKEFEYLKYLFNKYLTPKKIGEAFEPAPWFGPDMTPEDQLTRNEERAIPAAPGGGQNILPWRTRAQREAAEAAAAQAAVRAVEVADNGQLPRDDAPDLFRAAGIDPNEILANGFWEAWAPVPPLQAGGTAAQASVVDEVYARVSALRLRG